uniref:DZF domain-containing protein n=2 Tax=Ciona intestinalis TaxID=7719 RepID=F6Z677_CIOIN
MKKLEQQTSSPNKKEVDKSPEPCPENSSQVVKHSAPTALERIDEADKDQRLIGVVGYGCANIRLMLNSLQHLGHVVLCKNKVTKSFLRLFPDLIIEAFKSDPKHDVELYTVVLDEENEIIKITHSNLLNAVVEVRLTSPKYSLSWCTDTAEENPTNGLNVDNCLSNLTLIRRTRWFDRK